MTKSHPNSQSSLTPKKPLKSLEIHSKLIFAVEVQSRLKLKIKESKKICYFENKLLSIHTEMESKSVNCAAICRNPLTNKYSAAWFWRFPYIC